MSFDVTKDEPMFLRRIKIRSDKALTHNKPNNHKEYQPDKHQKRRK